MQEEKWKEGAAALEEWFKTAANPNSAAYYLLAVAYYQQDDFDKALPPAKKAVELMDKPQRELAAAALGAASAARGVQGSDPHPAAARHRRARQEDVLDAAVVGLRADGGLSERARDHAARELGRVS